METGNLITEVRPRRIVRKKPADRDPFGELKRMVNGYITSNYKEWFAIHRDGMLSEYFESIIVKGYDDEENIGDKILDIFRYEFVEDLTNRWNEPKCPSFFKQYKILNVEFTIRDFIKFWKDCSEWFNDNFDDDTLEIENEEQAWNSICFWVFQEKLMDEWEELFTENFKEEFSNYKDVRNRTSRIPCGVCYENKILYTGCFRCNGNYLCRTCYDKVNNECPFCRCDEMITEVNYVSEDLSKWVDKIVYINNIIPIAVENAIIDQCYECKKDIRWRDKCRTMSIEIDDGINCGELVCLKCYN
jgi:hypothetical protein